MRTAWTMMTIHCGMALGLMAGAAGADAPHPAPPVASAEPDEERRAASAEAWAPFVETNFPFFSSVLDARQLGEGWPADNLTPRGVILNLGQQCWACFDLDLLRLSAVWDGRGVTPVSMAQGSYQTAGVKAPEGQSHLPKIEGRPWVANGIYPGWQIGTEPSLTDPREPGPDPAEVGRGAMDPAVGRFRAIRLSAGGVQLEYDVAGAGVTEQVSVRRVDRHPVLQRTLHLERAPRPLCLVLGRRPASAPGALSTQLLADPLPDRPPVVTLSHRADGLVFVRVASSGNPVAFRVALSVDGPAPPWREREEQTLPARRWPQPIRARISPGPGSHAYVVDNIELPRANPWRRNVRVADVGFWRDGRAAAVTFDGDVWVLSGLDGRGRGGEVRWRRFASGLHEPLSLVIRDESLFVFDRNGIWRLQDLDEDGEADLHELFSNAFAQTAETREFATSMKLAPDGSLVIAKGGQESATVGKHNGTVLRVSADGRDISVLGWGLRMPFIGVHPRTGLITASDQQGHYVPATPLQVIRDHQYYGFIPLIRPKEQYPAPIAEPLTWIPHPVNASGVSQVWLAGARMGPLNESLIHLGYYRPELFLVLVNDAQAPDQAAVVSLSRDLAFPPLSGAVNPRDGQLYVAGFQIWGSEARQISGLARVRYTGAPSPFPRSITPMEQGILIRFDVPIEMASGTNPANFSAERWNYRRSANYGSPHYRRDGSKGQEAMMASSAYRSGDGQSLFVGIPDMKPVMQMRFGWSLTAAGGPELAQSAYFTPRLLPHFDPVKAGFAPVAVDLTPRRAALQAANTPVTAAEGQRISELMGCVACHSADGTTLGKVGPTWRGLFGAERRFADGTRGRADEEYLRQSIREPAAKVVSGFDQSDTGMPSYEGIITDAQIEALVAYIKTLASGPGAGDAGVPGVGTRRGPFAPSVEARPGSGTR